MSLSFMAVDSQCFLRMSLDNIITQCFAKSSERKEQVCESHSVLPVQLL